MALSILSDEFARIAADAGALARQTALRAGHPVVFVDATGRYVEELPNGQQFEVELDGSKPRSSHLVILRELKASAA